MTIWNAISKTLIAIIGVPLDAYRQGYNDGINDAIKQLKFLKRDRP